MCAAGYAAQSLLAALGCVQFVSNVFFASFVLKEQVSPAAGTRTDTQLLLRLLHQAQAAAAAP
jgi:hypothetical protein